MSFTWPDIPFQGTEVEEFATAYKELAEHILDDYFNGGPLNFLNLLEPAYGLKDITRELLQEGLFYACFIIQQRSGTSGPGTDFVLGNSPIDINTISESDNLAPKILKLLGCRWGDFEESYLNNIKCNNLPDVEAPEPEPNRCCEQGPNPLEGGLVNTMTAIMMAGNPYAGLLRTMVNKYLGCETDVVTASDVDSNDLQKIKEDLQNLINKRDRYLRDFGYAGGNAIQEKTHEYSSSQLASMGASRVFRVSTYGRKGHYLLGYVTVTTDADGNVLCMRDDYDFEYGWRMDRSDGSLPGDPYSGKTPGGYWYNSDGTARTIEEVQQAVDADNNEGRGPHRDMIINSFSGCDGGGLNGGGRGAPVPINVCFS